MELINPMEERGSCKKGKYALVLLGVSALLPSLSPKSFMINETKPYTDFTQQIHHSGTCVYDFPLNHIRLNCNEDFKVLLFENTESVIQICLKFLNHRK